MKTIVAPTDLTKASEHAVFYAAEIAKKTKAKLLLLHVFGLPYPDPYTPHFATDMTEVETQYLSLLDKLQKKIRKKYGNKVRTDYAIRFGIVTDEIETFAKRHKADLIVMGMRSTGTLEEKLLGSVTTYTIRHSKFPVLIVNKKNKFSAFKNIAFCYDYHPIDKKFLSPALFFARLFKSHLSIVHVNSHTERLPNQAHYQLSEKIDRILKGIPHTFFYIKNDNVVNGLDHFVKSKKMDLVFMLPHHHSFFARIFKEPDSKKLAFHSRVPVLTIKH